jgi:uncharacterized protein with GYD domain
MRCLPLPHYREGRRGMRTYILLLRNSAEGAQRMLDSGHSGATDQARAVEELHGKVVGQWAVTGRFDAVLVAELPDDAVAVALTLGATSAGQYVELLLTLDPEVIDTARDLRNRAVEALAGPPTAEATGPRAETPREPGG